jgi:casein kinase 1
LSYVRNLGFEDTPDYDYLRDLFTQALKNAGEVEDGEYDWMKLNNGKGWEAMKAHPSAHLHHANAVPNSSQRELHNANARMKQPVPPGRLDAELPKPGAVRQNQGRHGTGTPTRKDPAQYHADMKRKSGADLGPPEGSTQAQFQHSNQNLPARMSSSGPGLQSPMNANPQQQQAAARAPPEEPKEGGFKKLMKSLCCGT